MVGNAGVLAHQGGWDELLSVALPIGLLVALLRVANRRAHTTQHTAGEAGQIGPNHEVDRNDEIDQAEG